MTQDTSEIAYIQTTASDQLPLSPTSSLTMTNWTLVDTHPIRGRTFQRPLDRSEIPFFWEGRFAGTTDSMHHLELRLVDGNSRDARLFSTDNITRAWLSTKRRYPLSGAIVRSVIAPLEAHLERIETTHHSIPGSTQVYFVVREHDLTVLHPHEIVFEQVASVEEVQKRMAAILHGPRQLSDELLVKLFVFCETAPERSNFLHLVILASHCAGDWMAHVTFFRCLLDTLARGAGSEPVQIPLEERLATVVPPSDLEPAHLRSLSPAKRRWRRAVGQLIFQSRMGKNQGGHTLPCRFTRSTAHTPSRTDVIDTSLTPVQNAAVLSNCRLHSIMFGHAFLVAAQVAMTRILYRRYLRGEISEGEWEYRKRQPYIIVCPFTLRPYLDKVWFKNGGGGDFMTSSSRYVFQLPSMTLGTTVDRGLVKSDCYLSNGAPPFSDLLTFDQFCHRAGLIKKQLAVLSNHPLLCEIAGAATNMLDVERLRTTALEWMKRAKTVDDSNKNADEDEVLAVKDMPVVAAHWGSSLGDLDPILPFAYPIPPSHPLSPYSRLPHPAKAGYATTLLPSSSVSADMSPKILLENFMPRVQVRPGSIYLGTASWRGRLGIEVCYDGNVFEEVVVREWLEEIKEAMLWYLGSPHTSHQGQQNTAAAAVQAKL